MVITRTPLRISFVGGGTDLPAYYLHSRKPGIVLSATIDKYVYIMLNEKFDGKVRVSYSKTENTELFEEVQHELVRETMAYFGIKSGLEIVSVADIPGSGSGLGSSSAFTVGLIKAIGHYEGVLYNNYQLAEFACEIEMFRCSKFCGKQDQYAAAFGGMNQFTFYEDERVGVNKFTNWNTLSGIQESLLLFYLGPRKDKTILERQHNNASDHFDKLESMGDLVEELVDEINEYPCQLGQYLDINWEYKRQLAEGISNDNIQKIYQRAMEAGANGGKVLGQGGGGFMLFHASPKNHQSVIDAVGLAKVPFNFSTKGSEVIHAS